MVCPPPMAYSPAAYWDKGRHFLPGSVTSDQGKTKCFLRVLANDPVFSFHDVMNSNQTKVRMTEPDAERDVDMITQPLNTPIDILEHWFWRFGRTLAHIAQALYETSMFRKSLCQLKGQSSMILPVTRKHETNSFDSAMTDARLRQRRNRDFVASVSEKDH